MKQLQFEGVWAARTVNLKAVNHLSLFLDHSNLAINEVYRPIKEWQSCKTRKIIVKQHRIYFGPHSDLVKALEGKHE